MKRLHAKMVVMSVLLHNSVFGCAVFIALEMTVKE